jgi:hypothetical protein
MTDAELLAEDFGPGSRYDGCYDDYHMALYLLH